MAGRMDREFFFEQLDQMKEVRLFWKKASKSSALSDKAQKKAIIALANWVVMSVGWMVLDLIEKEDNGELLLAQQFRKTYLELILQDRWVAAEILQVLEEDKGEIIVPESKKLVVGQWRQMLDDAKDIAMILDGQHILDAQKKERPAKSWDEL